MDSYKHRSALLGTLNRKEVPIETTPQEVLSLMGVEAPSCPFFTFFDKELPPQGATHTRPLQIIVECMGAKVPMVLIDNGSTLNVCPFRTAFTIGLDVETIIPFLLTIKAYDNTSRKVIGTFKALCKISPIKTIVERHGFILNVTFS